ncbi:hypothetical protein JW906_00800 [bacterium]|nr:hypothetical protein [bacterium]
MKNRRAQKAVFQILWAVLFVATGRIAGQEPGNPEDRRIEKFLFKQIQISGSSEMVGELYNIQGAERRRPPSMGRISANALIQATRQFSMPVTVLWSTEGSYLSRDMNLIGFHPTWAWGRAHLGDFSSPLSEFTFSGVNVEGGGLEFWPGRLRFAVGGGRTHRAVTDIQANERFAQYLAAGKVGYEHRNGSFLDLIILKAKDDIHSLQPRSDYRYLIPDTLENEADTLWIDRPYYSVLPQENLLTGLAGMIRLFRNSMELHFEGTGSAFTRDITLYPIHLDSLDAPEFLRDLIGSVYKPRSGSLLDFAGTVGFDLRLDKFKISSGYTYIGPGYVSLGIPSTINDRQEWKAATSFQIRKNRFSLSWDRKSNNVLSQKLATDTRNQFRIVLNRNLNRLRSSFDLNILSMNAAAAADSLEWTYSNVVFNTNQALAFGPSSMIRQVGVRYTFQTSDKNATGSRAVSSYHTASLTGSIRPAESLLLNGSAGCSFRRSASQGYYVTQVYSLRCVFHALEKKWSSSLLIQSSMVRDMNVYRAGLDSAYKLTAKDAVKLDISHAAFEGSRTFRETRASVNISHRF